MDFCKGNYFVSRSACGRAFVISWALSAQSVGGGKFEIMRSSYPCEICSTVAEFVDEYYLLYRVVFSAALLLINKLSFGAATSSLFRRGPGRCLKLQRPLLQI